MPIDRKTIPTTGSLIMFESAARLGSFVSASEELFVSTAAVSKQIKQLEDLLQVKLFNRTRTGAVVTRAGEKYLETTRQVLDILEQGTSQFSGDDDSTVVLNVEVGLCFLHFWLLPKLDDFRHHYPHIQINLIVNNERTHVDDSDDFDVAFFYSSVDTSNRDNYLLFHDRVLLVASPNFVQTRLKDKDMRAILQQWKIMMKEELPMWEGWASFCHRLGVDYDPSDDILFVEDQVAVIQAALNDGGVALVTEWHVKDALESGQLVALTPTIEYENKAYFLSVSNRENNEAAKLLIEWVTSQVAPL
ncbi:LysR family transcriptional regulator [Vibrio alginolyticus]|uniref:LysR family transcriptional regulator n=1 Tax=Vibrio alginolyticus TaxID=663 RepID=UPI001BD69B68|nr:LysR family transcriptional regulator [Vibrio alginolyticus]ELA9243554.1 LysR family transcriptional regulator [Vibrio alginolyticus]ELA9245727.1 LysR family transcriptional regulator [Vibrio alginolyticus]MBT0083968.1 LysR family transcriptional regulator [Vibrio alginolyticus]